MSNDRYEPPSPELPAERKARLLDAIKRGRTIGGVSFKELEQLKNEAAPTP